MTRYLDARQPTRRGKRRIPLAGCEPIPREADPLVGCDRGASGGTCDEKRYQVAVDAGDTWQVIDTITNLPAASNGRDLSGWEKRTPKTSLTNSMPARLKAAKAPPVTPPGSGRDCGTTPCKKRSC